MPAPARVTSTDITRSSRDITRTEPSNRQRLGALLMQPYRLCLLISGVAISSIASAQDVPGNVGVADRARPLYDPLGIRAGSVLIYPRLKSQLEYDDNVLASSNGGQGDKILTVEPD